MRRAIINAQDAVLIGECEAGIQSVDRQRIEIAVTAAFREFETGLSTLPALFLRILEDSANAVVWNTPELRNAKREPVRKPPIEVAFDVANPAAVFFAENHAAELVTAITNESRLAVQQIITRAFTDGIAPRQAARLIRDVVGLTEPQSIAVLNLRTRILDSPGRRVFAGKVPIRVPRDGMSRDVLSNVVTKYAERLRNQRALTIAQTETMRASNEGQRQMWNQAVENGRLKPNVKRVWIVTPDDKLCPICAPLEGQLAGLHETFSGGFMTPPAHPRCRCTTGLEI